MVLDRIFLQQRSHYQNVRLSRVNGGHGSQMMVMETVVVQDVGRTGLPEQKTTDQVAVMTEMYFLQLWRLQGQGQCARVGFR